MKILPLNMQWNLPVGLILIALIWSTTVFAEEKSAADLGLCSAGMNQSPINIDRPTEAVLDKLRFRHLNLNSKLVEDAAKGSINFPAGSFVGIDGEQYALKRLSVRIPSEHEIHGRKYSMELQLEHETEDGELMFIALLFDSGTENNVLKELLKTMQPGDFESGFDPQKLLKSYGAYYLYNGSLTEAPCSEGVRWVVEATIQHASTEQISALKDSLVLRSSRPTQPLNARNVLK
jgi:carbonic anhydrase